MTNPSDTQRILLSSAAQRDNGSLLPLPATLKPGGGASKAVTALLKQGLAEERETNDLAAARRTEGDVRYGVFLTPAGATAVGVESEDDGNGSTNMPAPAVPPSAKAPSKTATVLALLTRPEGATLPELIEVTGWLPHTTRAALTGLRKKGHDVASAKRDGVTCYRIAEVA